LAPDLAPLEPRPAEFGCEATPPTQLLLLQHLLPFGPTVAHVQVKNRYRRDRILRTSSELVGGPKWRLDFITRNWEEGRRFNTSYVERQNLYERRSCSYLHRRTPGRARSLERLSSVLEILRVHYNYVRTHASLSSRRHKRTPAMAAGIFTRPLSLRAILSWVPRPRGGPPLRKLVEWTTLGRRARGWETILNSQRKGRVATSPEATGETSQR